LIFGEENVSNVKIEKLRTSWTNTGVFDKLE
jgi:hypothetical protein